ncbi:MAG: OsmC family protein [Gemmatimonadota bacterium]
MEEISVEWAGRGLEFIGRLGPHETVIDGGAESGPSPVALLLESTAACMAIDVVDILGKGRQNLEGLRLKILAKRMDAPPRYVRAMRFEFEIAGEVEEAKAERAVQLSFEKYCSVFHSLRPDIEVESAITFV